MLPSLLDMSPIRITGVPISLANFKKEAVQFSYLHDAAGRRINIFGRNRLNGVDDNQIGSCIFYMGKNLFQRGFTGYQQIVIFWVRNTDGPKLELAGTFFTGYVENSFVGKPQHRLEYQSRFSGCPVLLQSG